MIFYDNLNKLKYILGWDKYGVHATQSQPSISKDVTQYKMRKGHKCSFQRNAYSLEPNTDVCVSEEETRRQDGDCWQLAYCAL